MSERRKFGKRQVRALTYLPHGQACETWLPAGVYEHDGECTVTTRDVTNGPAVRLKPVNPAPGDGGTWYTGPAFWAAGKPVT